MKTYPYFLRPCLLDKVFAKITYLRKVLYLEYIKHFQNNEKQHTHKNGQKILPQERYTRLKEGHEQMFIIVSSKV